MPSVTSLAARADPPSRCQGPPTTRLPAIAPTRSAAATGASRGVSRRVRLGRKSRSRVTWRGSVRTAAMIGSTRSGTAGASSIRADARPSPRSNARHSAQVSRCRSSAATARDESRSPSRRADRSVRPARGSSADLASDATCHRASSSISSASIIALRARCIRLDRADPHAQDVGRLLIGQAEDLDEQERLAVLRGDRAERLLQLHPGLGVGHGPEIGVTRST